MPLISGREYDAGDDREAPRRVIVNRRLAEVGWPGRDPVGRRLSWSTAPDEDSLFEIVGVGGDVKDSPRDPWVLGGVVAVLTAVTVAANLLPARRAARVDPAAALRDEQARSDAGAGRAHVVDKRVDEDPIRRRRLLQSPHRA